MLLVDDDDISNFINQRVVLSTNVTDHIHVTKNGQEALDFIREHCGKNNETASCPDVVLLDVKMPIMDGFEFLTEFESTEKHLADKITIILLTSSNNPSDIARAKNFNVVGYINKPLTPDKLNEVFAQL
jgi:CheY-like chemotaxis protein